jgi:small subunit ribosomal protein S6
MNDYEVLLMLDAELPEERGGEIVARVKEQVEGDKGSWDGHEPWGRRKLAYEIDHKGEGIYHLLLFTSPPETLAEVTRVLKITDGVVRHLAVRRVKGGSTKAPALGAAVSAPAPTEENTPPAPPAAVEEAAPAPPAPVEEAAPAPSEDVSTPADDTDQAAE